MKHGVKNSIVLIGIAVAALSSCGQVPTPDRQSFAVPRVTMVKLVRDAREITQLCHSSPAGAVAVATRGRAVFLPGEMPGTASDHVYFISIPGNFKCYGFHHPQGSPVPSGKTLEITINAKTFKIMSEALPIHPINVYRLGVPFSLTTK
jgi:hypothetical protein